MSVNQIDNIIFPSPITQPARSKQTGNAVKPSEVSPFSKILDQKSTAPLAFSKHAQERLQARGITLSDQEIGKLGGLVESISLKGGKDSLVMMGSSAFVVNVPNRTVVTAIDRESMKGNVFTNIDSAVIA